MNLTQNLILGRHIEKMELPPDFYYFECFKPLLDVYKFTL